MGSGISIALQSRSRYAPKALDEAAGWFRQLERSLSRFDPDSDLCNLNRSSGAPTRVASPLWDAIRVALAAAEATEGLVTPTLLQAVELAGYDRSFDRLPKNRDQPLSRQTPSDQATLTTDFRGIVLDQNSQSVKLPTGMQLDLGGTAKGWAADTIVARLGKMGAIQVDAGGDIAMSGPMLGGQPWMIIVDSPMQPGAMLGVVRLAWGGIATSGRYYRKWQRNGVWQHHIIDPRTGRPATTDVVSATVAAATAVAAEVAAKRVLILGSRQGLAWLESEPTLAGLVVTDAGSVLESERMGQYW
jgi:thiamine biosynthesis lipoprotein